MIIASLMFVNWDPRSSSLTNEKMVVLLGKQIKVWNCVMEIWLWSSKNPWFLESS